MSLTPNFSVSGRVGASFDGTGGSRTNGGTIEVVVPEGSAIEAAFLYATTFATEQTVGATLTSGSNSLAVDDFVSLGENIALDTPEGVLTAYRSDVQDFIESVVDGGGADLFEIDVSNLVGRSIDGFALAVVYSNPTLDLGTIAILDGFSDPGGDQFTLDFGDGVDLTDPDFQALLSLGIGYGFQPSDQSSEIEIDGQLLTTSAGGQDDGSSGNGGLITIGGLGDDPANPDPNAGPDVDPTLDDELYDLKPFLEQGDELVVVTTENPSDNDNIFFAALITDPPIEVITLAPTTVEDSYTTTLNTQLIVAAENGVLANDSDPDGSVTGAIIVDDVSNGSLTFDETDGSFTFTPDPDFLGEVDFSYRAVDNEGNQSFETVVSIVVEDVTVENNPPNAIDDNFSVAQDTTLAADVTENDTDPDNDPLTVDVLTDVANGSLSFNTDGTFNYTPEAEFVGSDSFDYELSDGELTDTATVTITVEPIDCTIIDATQPSETFVFDGGLLQINNFDTDDIDREENTSDTLTFEFNGQTFALNEVQEILDFAALIESDGVGTTDAAFDSDGDLALILSRDADGAVVDGIVLTDIIENAADPSINDGLTVERLEAVSADMFDMFADENDMFCDFGPDQMPLT